MGSLSYNLNNIINKMDRLSNEYVMQSNKMDRSSDNQMMQSRNMVMLSVNLRYTSNYGASAHYLIRY